MMKHLRLLCLLFTSLWLMGCNQTLSSPTPTPTKTPLNDVSSATAHARATPTPEHPPESTPTPSTVAAYELQLEKLEMRATWLDSDDTHLYWTSPDRFDWESGDHLDGKIYRYPLAGGEIVKVVETKYPEGTVGADAPTFSRDWMVFVDRHFWSLYSPYILYAYNLRSGALIELFSDPRPQALPPAYALVDEWVAWTTLVESQKDGCSADSVLVLQNIVSGERRELDRICIDDNYMWRPFSGIGMTEHYIVVEQQIADSQGGGHFIHLFDRQSGQRRRLSEGYGRMPAINGDWVAWRDMRALDDADGVTIALNLKTGERKEIPYPTSPDEKYPYLRIDEPYIVGNRWLYWDVMGDVFLPVYDLATDKMYMVRSTPLSPYNVGLGSAWHLSERLIAWSLDRYEHGSGRLVESTLHWRTGPDLWTLLESLTR